MAGTLTATVSIATTFTAQLAGSGVLDTAAAQRYTGTGAALAGGGALDVAAVTQLASTPAVFAGAGAFTTGLVQRYTTVPAALTGAGALTAATATQYARDAALTGTGTLTATAVITGVHLTDNFNRADSTTTLGTNWTTRESGQLGINGNAAYPASTYSLGSAATHNTTMASNDHKVTITMGTQQGTESTEETHLLLGWSYDYPGGDRGAGLMVKQGYKWEILTNTRYFTGGTSRATTASTMTYTTGDVISFERSGNVYTAKKNGATIGLSWTDSSNYVPRDANHRYVGLLCYSVNPGSHYRRVDSWSADDL